ncbi:hypothetical protein LTR37_005754 [Vermiconidia calcicola]|uniref:Uncharacterized protein n=1 Tax=Vermiconidia calcicola TaxID=1690605 RepID=A0ACC3NIB5_9PEZI|nr:hypothetical protein LTR37_005754 [Vermiconidia calcicola]
MQQTSVGNGMPIRRMGQGMCLALATAACLTVSIGCSPSRTLDKGMDVACTNGEVRWIALTCLFVVPSLALLPLSILAYGRVKLPLSRRVKLIISFPVMLLLGNIVLFCALPAYQAFAEAPSTDASKFYTLLQGWLVATIGAPVFITELTPMTRLIHSSGVVITTDESTSQSYGRSGIRSGGRSGISLSQKIKEQTSDGDEMPLTSTKAWASTVDEGPQEPNAEVGFGTSWSICRTMEVDIQHERITSQCQEGDRPG